jgi:hypothetical protein
MASDRIQTTITCPACTEEITIPTRAQWHGDGTGTVTFDTSAVRAHIAQHHTEQEHPVTRFALDTEFIEDGRTIDLVSIALVAEDGRELYAVSSKFSQAKLLANPWLAENVWPSLPTVKHGKGVTCRCINGNKYGHLDLDHPDVRPRAQIARMVRDFVLGTDPDMLPHVELWADYSAYDHVALAQLYGRMIDLPEGMPMTTFDVRQAAAYNTEWGSSLPEQQSGLHNALEDARHVMAQLRHLGIVGSPA